MTDKKLSELTNQELLDKAKKLKSKSITNALLIGCIVGIVIYGVAKNNLGFLTLIPLYFAYKIFNNPDEAIKNQELEKLLKERKLK